MHFRLSNVTRSKQQGMDAQSLGLVCAYGIEGLFEHDTGTETKICHKIGRVILS
jgi:hypothetical protein